MGDKKGGSEKEGGVVCHAGTRLQDRPVATACELVGMPRNLDSLHDEVLLLGRQDNILQAHVAGKVLQEHSRTSVAACRRSGPLPASGTAFDID